ncbi:hypothetical protein SRABI106_04640 [Rahnella aquatilis]|nr:hypothetical protein SRABI106_04640 [Rahnella aquatilis]
MTDVQITIRLRWETGVNGIVLPGRQIFINNLTDKICWAGFSLTHCAIPLRNIDSTDNRLCSNKPRRETTVSCIKSWLSLVPLSSDNKKREEIALFPLSLRRPVPSSAGLFALDIEQFRLTGNH